MFFSLNKYVENLEHCTGVKLLDINKKCTSLTTPGEYIVNIANQIEKCLSETYNVKNFYQSGELDKFNNQIKLFSSKMEKYTQKLDFENAMKYRNKIRKLEKARFAIMSGETSQKIS